MRSLPGRRTAAVFGVAKRLLTGGLLLYGGWFVFQALHTASAETRLLRGLAKLPDHNYLPDIEQLREEGKLTAAYEMSRVLVDDPTLPGHAEALRIHAELDRELHTLWGRAKRAGWGFLTGSGQTTEALGGAIASDMLLYGDIRDLARQGYYKLSGKPTDPVVAALATAGLATELIDIVDWAPATLKAFRKAGALSGRLADSIVSACRRSVRSRQLDAGLKAILADLKRLKNRMGLARTTQVVGVADTPGELRTLARAAGQDADATYAMVRAGGKGALGVLQELPGSGLGTRVMRQCARKGDAAIAWLKRGGGGRKHLLRVRYAARIAKTTRLGRPEALLVDAFMRSDTAFRWGALACVVLVLGGLASLAWAAGRLVRLVQFAPSRSHGALPFKVDVEYKNRRLRRTLSKTLLI